VSQLKAINDVATKIHAAQVTRKLTVANSVAYITGHAGDLAKFQYIDDLAAELDRDESAKDARAISFHMENVRNELARELWQRGLGVGLYTLDELLFRAVKRGDPDPVVSVLDQLRRSEQNAPGLVIFPLHSFGVLAAGLLQPFGRRAYTLVRPGAGYAITTQTNSIRRTISGSPGTDVGRVVRS
jgi:hypothetical protein